MDSFGPFWRNVMSLFVRMCAIALVCLIASSADARCGRLFNRKCCDSQCGNAKCGDGCFGDGRNFGWNKPSECPCGPGCDCDADCGCRKKCGPVRSLLKRVFNRCGDCCESSCCGGDCCDKGDCCGGGCPPKSCPDCPDDCPDGCPVDK